MHYICELSITISAQLWSVAPSILAVRHVHVLPVLGISWDLADPVVQDLLALSRALVVPASAGPSARMDGGRRTVQESCTKSVL